MRAGFTSIVVPLVYGWKHFWWTIRPTNPSNSIIIIPIIVVELVGLVISEAERSLLGSTTAYTRHGTLLQSVYVIYWILLLTDEISNFLSKWSIRRWFSQLVFGGFDLNFVTVDDFSNILRG